MSKLRILPLLVAILALGSCGKAEQKAAPVAHVQPAAITQARLTAASAPQPVAVLATLEQKDACADKAMATNHDTLRSSRRVKIGATKQDVAGSPATFKKGDSYWSICAARLNAPRTSPAAAAATAKASTVDLTRFVPRAEHDRVRALAYYDVTDQKTGTKTIHEWKRYAEQLTDANADLRSENARLVTWFTLSGIVAFLLLIGCVILFMQSRRRTRRPTTFGS